MRDSDYKVVVDLVEEVYVIFVVNEVSSLVFFDKDLYIDELDDKENVDVIEDIVISNELNEKEVVVRLVIDYD